MPRTTQGVRDPEAVLRSLRAEREDHRRTKAALNAAEQRADAAGVKLQREKRASEAAATRAAKQREKDDAERVELRERLAAAELTLARLEVASEKGLPRAAVERLRGETREELEADADDFLDLMRAPAR